LVTETRHYATDAPCARIWNSGATAIERTILWDQARNGYKIEYFNWDDEIDADPTKVESKHIYEHLAGWRLRCVLSFNVWQPNRGPYMGPAGSINLGFTENDLSALQNARKAGQHIEFFLHGRAAGNGRTVARCCKFSIQGSERPERQVMHRMMMEFEGLDISTVHYPEL
jgi:hypothetical protein